MTGGASFADLGPHVHVHVPIGIRLPADLARTTPLIGSPPLPAVVVGRFDAKPLPGCTAERRLRGRVRARRGRLVRGQPLRRPAVRRATDRRDPRGLDPAQPGRGGGPHGRGGRFPAVERARPPGDARDARPGGGAGRPPAPAARPPLVRTRHSVVRRSPRAPASRARLGRHRRRQPQGRRAGRASTAARRGSGRHGGRGLSGATRPPAIVSRTTPGSSRPSSGEFCPFDRSDAGVDGPRRAAVDDDEVGRLALAERRRRAARAPRAPAPGPSSAPRSPARAAGRPASTAASTTPIAVSMPLIPLAAQPNSTCLSTSVWGAWSVAMASAVPSSSAASTAAASSAGRSGGLTRSDVSNGAGDDRPVRPRVERAPVGVERLPRPAAHAGDPLVREGEVVRRDVAGHGQPGRLRGADVGERAAVETWVRWSRAPGTSPTTSARIAIERATEPDSARSRPALEAEHGRDVALGRLGALGERRVLRVVDDRAARARPAYASAWPRMRRRADRRAVVREARRRRHRPARRARRASRPARPAVTAPWTSTRTGDPDAVAAAAGSAPTTDGSSIAGVVLGIRHTVVNPPCAAAASPVATVSASSLPGSRKCACRSTNPGTISDAVGPEAVGVVARRATRTRFEPPVPQRRPRRRPRDRSPGRRSSRGSPGPRRPRRPRAGAAHEPASGRVAGEQVQQRHPHRDAVGHLVRDHRPRVDGDVGRDLDALVHRPRVHDDDVRRRGPQPLPGQPVARRVLAQRRQQPRRHPLPLDPQRHHDVGVPQARPRRPT